MTDRPFDDKPQITNFERVVDLLEDGLIRYQSNLDDTVVRDGLVHRMKVAYELACKMLVRYLLYASPGHDAVNQMGFPDLIRTGNEQGLLYGDWMDWKEFRRIHEQGAYAYQDVVANEIVDSIPRFLEDARYLRDQLRERLA